MVDKVEWSAGGAIIVVLVENKGRDRNDCGRPASEKRADLREVAPELRRKKTEKNEHHFFERLRDSPAALVRAFRKRSSTKEPHSGYLRFT